MSAALVYIPAITDARVATMVLSVWSAVICWTIWEHTTNYSSVTLNYLLKLFLDVANLNIRHCVRLTCKNKRQFTYLIITICLPERKRHIRTDRIQMTEHSTGCFICSLILKSSYYGDRPCSDWVMQLLRGVRKSSGETARGCLVYFAAGQAWLIKKEIKYNTIT